MTQSLERALLDAHDSGDKSALVTLYSRAAKDATTDVAQRFFLTHAYVFALDCGHADVDALKEQLVALGAEPR